MRLGIGACGLSHGPHRQDGLEPVSIGLPSLEYKSTKNSSGKIYEK